MQRGTRSQYRQLASAFEVRAQALIQDCTSGSRVGGLAPEPRVLCSAGVLFTVFRSRRDDVDVFRELSEIGSSAAGRRAMRLRAFLDFCFTGQTFVSAARE